jgi:hypothetical protein
MHGHSGSRPDRSGATRDAPTFARLSLASARWAVVGLVLVASFWTYLGVAELAGDATREGPAAEDATLSRGPGCTVLTLDRSSGRTSAAPCMGPALMLRETLAGRLPDPASR